MKRDSLKREITDLLDRHDQITTMEDIAGHLNNLMEKALNARFTTEAKEAFKLMFELVGKKFANVIKSVQKGGVVYTGDQMAKIVVQKFEDDHRDREFKPSGVNFP